MRDGEMGVPGFRLVTGIIVLNYTWGHLKNFGNRLVDFELMNYLEPEPD